MNSISSPARGIGSAIDFGVAALAAVSVGFLTFAMPENLFSSLVSATHLPDILAAAAPPLGTKARFAMVGADFVLVFALVWALLRGLGSAPAARPARKPVDPGAPRVRRADAHPDAPARRPLLAGADLGEPEMDIYELDTPEPVIAHGHEIHDPAAEPDRFEAPARFEPVEDHDQPVAEEAAPSRLPRFLTAEESEPAPVRDPVVPPSQKRSVDSLAARLPDGPEPSSADSIGSLMQRLERGLSEREEPATDQAAQPEPELPAALASASANPDASLSPEGVRHRLRSAISDLNQVANRG